MTPFNITALILPRHITCSVSELMQRASTATPFFFLKPTVPLTSSLYSDKPFSEGLPMACYSALLWIFASGSFTYGPTGGWGWTGTAAGGSEWLGGGCRCAALVAEPYVFGPQSGAAFRLWRSSRQRMPGTPASTCDGLGAEGPWPKATTMGPPLLHNRRWGLARHALIRNTRTKEGTKMKEGDRREAEPWL